MGAATTQASPPHMSIQTLETAGRLASKWTEQGFKGAILGPVLASPHLNLWLSSEPLTHQVSFFVCKWECCELRGETLSKSAFKIILDKVSFYLAQENLCPHHSVRLHQTRGPLNISSCSPVTWRFWPWWKEVLPKMKGCKGKWVQGIFPLPSFHLFRGIGLSSTC